MSKSFAQFYQFLFKNNLLRKNKLLLINKMVTPADLHKKAFKIFYEGRWRLPE